MTRTSSTARSTRPLALLPLAVLACVLPTPLGELPSTTAASETTEPGSDGSTTIDTSASGSTAGPPAMTSDTGIAEPPPPHAWAMRYDQWSTTSVTGGNETGPDSGGTGGDTSTEPSPDTLVVQLSTGPDDCDDPHAGLECGGHWTLTLLLPPALQVPGTYDLATELSALVIMTGEAEGGGVCSGGAGTAEGTAELFEVSPQQVTGRVSTTDGFGIGPSHEFVAPRC